MKYIYIIILLTLPGLLQSQTVLEKADSLYGSGNYRDAISCYQKTLERTRKQEVKNRIYINIAEAYKSLDKYKAAEEWYKKAIDNDYAGEDLYQGYGEVLMKTGDYANAKKYFERYQKKLKETDIKLRDASYETKYKLTENKIHSCDYAISQPKEKSIYTVRNVKELNSEYSDYGIMMINEQLVISSSRMEKKADRTDPYTLQGYSDFYSSKQDRQTGQWTKPVMISGGINTKYNDGIISFCRDNSRGYFMQCNGAKGKEKHCNIQWSRYNKEQDKWGEANVFEEISGDYNTGHPCLSADCRRMYFVSDMPGGYGGKDIWVITKEGDNKWGKAKNMGPEINTAGDEEFPTMRGDSMLYFASNGHPGFGGLDIFSCQIPVTSYQLPEPKNLGAPFNSSADDFGIIYREGRDEGFFCSNRTGGLGEDDIYTFELVPVVISCSGRVTDKNDNQPLPGSRVLLRLEGKTVDSTLTDEKGIYKFTNLKQKTGYNVKAEKEGYFADSKDFTTKSEKFSTEYSGKNGYELDLSLMKITKEEIVIDNIYYDFDKWDLRPESFIELDKLVKLLTESPKVKIVINSHTDERGKPDYNLKLSEKRAESVVNYLISRGISAERLSSKGYGATMPLIKNAKDDDEHQKNRRTTFKVVEK